MALGPVVLKNTRYPLGYEFCKSSPSLLHFWIELFYRVFTLLHGSSIWRCRRVGRRSHCHFHKSCTCSLVLKSLHCGPDNWINWILCSILLEQKEFYTLAEAVLCEFWLYLAILVWVLGVLFLGFSLFSFYDIREFRGNFLEQLPLFSLWIASYLN